MSKELMRPGLPDILRINIPNMEKLDRIWRFIPVFKYRSNNVYCKWARNLRIGINLRLDLFQQDYCDTLKKSI